MTTYSQRIEQCQSRQGKGIGRIIKDLRRVRPDSRVQYSTIHQAVSSLRLASSAYRKNDATGANMMMGQASIILRGIDL
jgi:hypothetical protein